MGKRSDFERVEKDYYRTIDPRAVAALAPHLPERMRFCEPCAGAGDLMDQLAALGHECKSAFDIDPQRSDIALADVLTFDYKRYAPFDLFITNPPWSRPVLHAIIDRLSAQRPTWLLFDADWMHTEQRIMARRYGVKDAPELMQRCVKIVSVGRLIWIPGTKMQGKDSCCWYLFDERHTGATEFVGRQ